MNNNQEYDSTNEANAALFMHLVMTLATSALQHLGKIVNPTTQKAEVHLDAAQATIDMLDMLEVKTRGNLDPDESKMLKDTLTSLKLNYVETLQAAPATTPPPAAEEKPTGQAEPQIEQGAPKDGREARFHKTY
ncbi:MAG TPA: DUF1844 domain-containing protein [Verrucomicrobia bacterium]|nr:MAG: hypothetical protein A2X46_11470 [Lentisphaerae bacterium GWF2_57_35]HBA85044.1 DUF1844 domain-containing protein [Verrucomicrobiota bacterium]